MPQLLTPSRISSSTQAVAPNVYRIPTGISNAYFVALDADQYVIIDAGGSGYGKRIIDYVSGFFANRPPLAILLTHAHFDHAAGLPELLRAWPRVPVYAHPFEFPYLRAREPHAYPPGDPTVGGAMANLSRMLDSSRPTPLRCPLHPLPETRGELPMMPGWESIPTPGHTPGHVSFWHPSTRLLIAGDAIITMNPNNPIKVLSQKPELSSPPPFATYNWLQAERSAHILAELEPYYLCAGHGLPMQGPEIASMLTCFLRRFPIPKRGRYIDTPARFNRSGPVYIPPPVPDYTKRAIATGATLSLILTLYLRLRKHPDLA